MENVDKFEKKRNCSLLDMTYMHGWVTFEISALETKKIIKDKTKVTYINVSQIGSIFGH